MKTNIFLLICIFSFVHLFAQSDSIIDSEKYEITKRMKILDESSPMDLAVNEINYKYIKRYLGRDVKLISRMLGISPYYFPSIIIS